MGSTNSPAVACRFGESVLEAFRKECPQFQAAEVVTNTWHEALNGRRYDPTLGHGSVLFRKDGKPVALVLGSWMTS